MNVYLAHGAEASLSMADANLEGVKPFDPIKIDPRNQVVTIGVYVVAATSLCTALFAMYIEASIIAYLAFAFPLITGPMVISQRRKIQWIPSKYCTVLYIQGIVFTKRFPCPCLCSCLYSPFYCLFAALKEECNKMRLSVNELAMERNRLEIENGRLERQMKRYVMFGVDLNAMLLEKKSYVIFSRSVFIYYSFRLYYN
jgi:hypothetical protein